MAAWGNALGGFRKQKRNKGRFGTKSGGKAKARTKKLAKVALAGAVVAGGAYAVSRSRSKGVATKAAMKAVKNPNAAAQAAPKVRAATAAKPAARAATKISAQAVSSAKARNARIAKFHDLDYFLSDQYMKDTELLAKAGV